MLALVFIRVRSRDVETSILHEVEVGVSTTELSPARKALAAVCYQFGIISFGSGIGLSLLGTILVVFCDVRSGVVIGNPKAGANEQRQTCRRKPPSSLPVQFIHQPIPLTDLVTAEHCGLLRGEGTKCVPIW